VAERLGLLLFFVDLGFNVLSCDPVSVDAFLLNTDRQLLFLFIGLHLHLLLKSKLGEQLLVLKLPQQFYSVFVYHGGAARRAHFVLLLFLRGSLFNLIFPNLITQLLEQLHLFEAFLLLHSLVDLLLHHKLLPEVYLLEFAKLTHPYELVLVAGQSLTHCELVLVFTAGHTGSAFGHLLVFDRGVGHG